MTAMTIDDVLAFWLGPPGDPPLAKSASWWKKDEAFDAEIRARFGEAIERAARGEMEAWRSSPRGRLALVILLDQFSRNAFRGTPRSFAQDALALEVARQGVSAGDLAVLTPVEASFLLMPLMHAEEPAMQARCVEGFAELCARTEGDTATKATMTNALDFAKKHEAIVVRFGRFPHRNAVLGRESTDEEREFLTTPGSSF